MYHYWPLVDIILEKWYVPEYLLSFVETSWPFSYVLTGHGMRQKSQLILLFSYLACYLLSWDKTIWYYYEILLILPLLLTI